MPKVKVTIDIFSGRPNPEIELTSGEAGQVMRLLATARRLEQGEPGLPETPTLGYRGLIVEQIGTPVGGLPRTMRVAHGSVFGPRAPRVVENDALEEVVLKDARLRRIGRQFPRVLANEIERYRKLRLRWPYFPPVKLQPQEMSRPMHLLIRMSKLTSPLHAAPSCSLQPFQEPEPV